MSDQKKREDLSKLNLVELKEILHRENLLLNNRKLVEKLPDKGESIKTFRGKVEKEIKYRNDIEEMDKSVNQLSLSENEKHIQRICQIEKIPEKERYKPFATLNKTKDIQPDSKIFQIMEDCAHCNKPTKLILLPESIDILKKQDNRVKEEQLRARHQRILEKLTDYEGNDSDASSSQEFPEDESNDQN